MEGKNNINEIGREKSIQLKNLIYKYIPGSQADDAIRLFNELLRFPNEFKTVYQVEHNMCPGSNFCEVAMIDIKRRMIFRLIKDIPFEELEKVFQITIEERPQGDNINIKIEI